MNRNYVHVLYCLSKWIEFVNIFCIVCLYVFRWWWSRYCVRSVGKDRAKFCFFSQIQKLCFDLLLSLSFICIENIFILFLLFIYQFIGLSNKWLMLPRLFFFCINPIWWFEKIRNVLYLVNIWIYIHRNLWRLRLNHSITKVWWRLHCCQ
jgi:hypothetical protein